MPGGIQSRSLLILAALACASYIAVIGCGAQETASAYTVHGVVKNSLTGQPIPRALVDAQSDAVLTDSQGRFELRLQEGFAQLQARRPGYLDWNRQGGRPVRVGAKTGEQTLYLVPTAGITGHVIVTNGGEAQNIAFTAYRKRTVNGHDRWMPAGMATTNSEGIFRIPEMEAPAVYVLCSRAARENLGLQPPGAAIVGYPPTCYPANPGEASANLLPLAVGQQAVVEIPISRQPFYTVSLTEQNAQQGPGMGFQIHDQNGLQIAFPSRWDEHRRTAEVELPNGNYTVDAHGWGNTPAYGRVDFKVANAPLNGLSLTILPLAPISVEIRDEFTGKQPPADTINFGGVREANSGVNLMLNPVDAMVDNGGGQALEHPKGADRSHYELNNVVPGRYWVQASYFLGGYISSIASGGVDLMREPLVVGPGNSTEPIDITLRNDGAEIDCTVSSPPVGGADADAAADDGSESAFVFAIPESPRSQTIQRAGASLHAPARLQNLAPGTYRVVALDQFRDLDAVDAQELAKLVNHGKTVTVAAGETVNVQVDLTKAGEDQTP